QKGAQVLSSGVIYIPEKEGTGPAPKSSDEVTVNYAGKLSNGTEFDSSYKRKEPLKFQLDKVIPCWTEGVQKMKVGGKARLVCPAKAGYGENGQPRAGIPGGSVLDFSLELLDASAPPAPTVPPPRPRAGTPPAAGRQGPGARPPHQGDARGAASKRGASGLSRSGKPTPGRRPPAAGLRASRAATRGRDVPDVSALRAALRGWTQDCIRRPHLRFRHPWLPPMPLSP